MAQRYKSEREQRNRVEQYVSNRIAWLQNHRSESRSKGLLAALRKTVAAQPGETLETCEFEFGRLPNELKGRGSEPVTAGEWAAHLAFALYAVHQQSQDAEMYRKCDIESSQYWGLGNAVKLLSLKGAGEQLEQGQMPSRFAALVTSESVEELAHYARQLVQQLRGASIPLDYGRVAGQLYWYQIPEFRNRVCLEWAREFSQSTSDGQNEPDDSSTAVEQSK